MDDKLPAKTVKFMSFENLYVYSTCFLCSDDKQKLRLVVALCVVNNKC